VYSNYLILKKLLNKIQFSFGILKANTIDLFSKRDFIVIAFFTLLGAGGVFAAGLITISAPEAQGAGYTAATACDENVTIKALTAPQTSSGQLYVATIALSDISQNATTGCGNQIIQIALKINGQMSYASWSIPAASTDSTFYLTGATSSINTYYADTLLSPFQADGLTNVAISQIGSFVSTSNWTWTERQPTAATTRLWRTIASSTDGTKLAALSADSTNNISTSTDSGVNWATSSYINAAWRSITSSSDGTKLAGVSAGAYISLSTNSGASFTNNSNIVALGKLQWNTITSSADGTKLAAGVYGGYIYTSSDSGATWSEIQPTSGTPRNWSSITSSSDGTKLAAVVQNGYIYTSTDSGATWTERTGTGTRAWYSVTSSSDGTKLAAGVYGGYIYTSTDSGVTWTETQPTASTPRNWYSITSSSDGTKLAAVAYDGYIYTGTR